MRSPCFLIRSAYSPAAAARACAVSSPLPLRATSSSDSPPNASPLTVPTIDLDDLRSHVQSSTSPTDVTANAVQEAFTGRSSLGSISIRVPGFDEVRRNALAAGAWLALDPSAASARNSCHSTELGEDARVQPGWSGQPGQEDHPIQSGFYCNLQEELALNTPADEFFGSNIWPAKDACGDARMDFKDAFLRAGRTMHEVTSLVLEAARDAIIFDARRRGLKERDFTRIAIQSDTFSPLRLTYYDANHSREDTLTGGQYLLPWHVDFNMATAFIAAEWIDEERALKGGGIEINDKENDPEKHAGLLLRNAAGDVVPASIAKDCILVQLGAYAQLASGGLLRAGPHAVGLQRGGTEKCTPSQGRLTMGLFSYAPWDARMLPPNTNDKAAVLEDDFGGLMKRAYTGDTVLAGFQSFANYMNAPRTK